MVTESEVSFSVATESECVSSVTPETEGFILFTELRKEVSIYYQTVWTSDQEPNLSIQTGFTYHQCRVLNKKQAEALLL